MKLSVKWLKEYVGTKLSAEKIADKLTMAGLEVDEIVGGHSFSGVVVGHVISVEKHPNASRLNIATVDIGDEKLQIVCGATNLKAGQKVPVAIVGAKLGDYEISKVSLRGVDSHGMICSEKELGLGEDHSGIMVLEKSEKIGEVYISDKGSDTVLDVKVLANRPDCMSVFGLANEVAVVTGSQLKLPGIKLTETGKPVDFSIKVEDNTLCPRYMARFVTDLTLTESPAWMKERLIASGVRPISLFVDISNYVMMEYGQPLHFFDLDKLTDRTIIVRSGKAGETMTTLDGVKRKLTKDNLVIADKTRPIALAGVMGGLDTEIDENTKNILIEAAIFEKSSIRKTSRALGLRSEAVARFEKGIAPMLPEVAINRAAELLQTLGQGSVSKTKIDVYPKLVANKPINLDITKMNAFLGTKISEKETVDVLTSLGFEIKGKGSVYAVTAPFWRVDIAEDVDLYEEAIRIIGYDKVPETLPKNIEVVPQINRYYKCVSRIRNRLAALGFDEIMTYSFIGAEQLTAIGADVGVAPVVQNPLVSDQQHLRTTLVPQMLQAVCDNQFHAETLKFFEIGKSFEIVAKGKLPKEADLLVLGLTTDFYDAKGIIYNLLAGFGIHDGEIVVKATSAEYLKRGVGADLFVQGKKLVTLGEIREEVRGKFDIKKSVILASLNIDILQEIVVPEVKFEQFSRFQQVSRDVSAVFGSEVTAQEIKQKLIRSDKLVKNVEIVDIYQGKGLEPNERSITIRFYIQSDERTLTDIEVDEVMKVIHNKVTELGGKIRGGSKA